MKKMKFVKVITMGLALVTMFATGCGSTVEKKETPKAKTTQVFTVGTNAAFAPFEFQEEGKKEYSGYDMDLARAVGKQMGMETKIVGLGFDGIIPAIISGNLDAAFTGMTINDERKKKVSFSQPYYQAGLTILVNKDNTTIKSIKDLEGKKIAVQIGTTGADMAKSIKGATVVTFNNNTDACLELKNEGVDAVIGDLPVEQYFLTKGGNEYAKIVGETLSSEYYGIAVAKDNVELLKKIDKAIDELQANGEFAKIYKKWFATEPIGIK